MSQQSRRSFLGKLAKLAGGGAVALAVGEFAAPKAGACYQYAYFVHRSRCRDDKYLCNSCGGQCTFYATIPANNCALYGECSTCCSSGC